MFQINSYLQYRNTPDGKPRVLREEIDYTNPYNNQLVDINRLTYVTGKVDDHEAVAGMMKPVANLSDCRPLLSVENKNKSIRELTIFQHKFMPELHFMVFFDGKSWLKVNDGGVTSLMYWIDWNAPELNQDDWGLTVFESDPAKYSKLLWQCSEEEGWDKVFKLLGIEI